MRSARCPDCQKMVRDKPIFGTIHICLSPEERRNLYWHRVELKHMQRGQLRLMSGPSVWEELTRLSDPEKEKA